MITLHQAVLANLVLLYPNNTGLARAYNNSLLLEQKFGEKTEMRFTRFIEKNNKTIFKAVRLEIRKQDHAQDDNTTAGGTMEQDRYTIREKIKDQKDMIQVNRTITPQTGSRNDTPTIVKNPQEAKDPHAIKEKTGVTNAVTRLLSTGPVPITTRGILIHDGVKE